MVFQQISHRPCRHQGQAHRPAPTSENWHLPPATWQLPTENWQLPTDNWHL